MASWREIRAVPALATSIVERALLHPACASAAPPTALTIRDASLADSHIQAVGLAYVAHADRLAPSRLALEAIGARDAAALCEEASGGDELALTTLTARYRTLRPRPLRLLADYLLARDEPWFEEATRQIGDTIHVSASQRLDAAIQLGHLALVDAAVRALDDVVGAAPLREALHAFAHDRSSERRGVVERLLSARVSLATAPGEETPLAAAAQTTVELVERLLALGADLAQSSAGETALHRASDAAIVRRLVDAGADVHARDRSGAPPILRASSVAVLEALVDAGADLHVTDAHGNPLLYLRCRFDETGELTRHLVTRGLDVHARVRRMRTALHEASAAAIPMLLAAGADLEARDELGATPLLTAFMPDACRALLAAGATIAAVDHRGLTVLHRTHHADCLEVLLAAGALLDARDHAGRTPLEHAAWMRTRSALDVTEDPMDESWLIALQGAG